VGLKGSSQIPRKRILDLADRVIGDLGEDGAEIELRIEAVELGRQVGLGSTESYLSLTPERFRTRLDKLSPRRGKKKWRDDPALMNFLAGL
jgi:hypothetical protein